MANIETVNRACTTNVRNKMNKTTKRRIIKTSTSQFESYERLAIDLYYFRLRLMRELQDYSKSSPHGKLRYKMLGLIDKLRDKLDSYIHHADRENYYTEIVYRGGLYEE